MRKKLILSSEHIYTGTQSETFAGSITIEGNRITKVSKKRLKDLSKEQDVDYIDLGEKMICPGFVDTHTFFTGYAINYLGINFSKESTAEQCLEKIEHSIKNTICFFGHGLNLPENEIKKLKNAIQKRYTDQSVILISSNREFLCVSHTAKAQYGIIEGPCIPEKYYTIMKLYLSDKAMISPIFEKYMAELHKKGITSIKEIGFDDFYGFLSILEEKDRNKELSLRVAFMSQPQQNSMDLEFGKMANERYTSPFLFFSGFNIMTDGTIATQEGDLKKPYKGTNITCKKNIDYRKIEQEVIMANTQGLRCTLHAQGDNAISKAISIFEESKKKSPKEYNRNGITDLEFTDPIDLKRMKKAGIVAEIYPQIMSLNNRSDTVATINKQVGQQGTLYYWNRRGMIDEDISVSCATDLPLLFPDIPSSILHSCFGYFSYEEVSSTTPYNSSNLMKISEILNAWTVGGQYNIGREEELGTLEEGKLADIAVLNKNILYIDKSELETVYVDMTISDGRIVYRHELI